MRKIIDWLIVFLTKIKVRFMEKDLANHVKNCKRCRVSDLDNCDETMFCRVGRKIFVQICETILVEF